MTYYENAVRADQRATADPGLAAQLASIEAYRGKVKDLGDKLADMRRAHPDLRFPTVDDQGHKTDPYDGEISVAQGQVNDYTTKIAGLTSQLNQVES